MQELIDELAQPVVKSVRNAINTRAPEKIENIFSHLTKAAQAEIYSHLDRADIEYIMEVLEK